MTRRQQHKRTEMTGRRRSSDATQLRIREHATDEIAPRDGPARRAAIVRQSVGVFARDGYDGASLRVLAAEVGMQKGHLSYYFPTKDDLLFEIVDDLHERFLRGIATWSEGGSESTEVTLIRIFEGHIKLVCAAHEQTRVAYECFRFLTEQRRATVVAKRRRYEHELTLQIERCRADGLVVEGIQTQFLTKSVLGMLNWPYHWYSPSGSHTPDQLAVIFAERAIAALRPAPRPDSARR